MKKILYIFILFLLLLNVVSIFGTSFNVKHYADFYVSCNTNNNFNRLNHGSPSTTNIIVDNCNRSDSNGYINFYYYYGSGDNLISTGGRVIDNGYVKYTPSPIKYWGFNNNLPDIISDIGSCKINTISFDSSSVNISANFNITSNSYNKVSDLNESDKNSHYYMKAFVFMNVSKYNSYVEYLKPVQATNNYTYNKINYNQSFGTTKNQLNYYENAYKKLTDDKGRVPFVLLKPGDNINNFTFNLDEVKKDLQNKCNDEYKYCGNYNITVYAVPIDGKCDFNNDGILNKTEFSANFSYSSFRIEFQKNNGILTRLNNFTEYNDSYTRNKIIFNPITNLTLYTINSTSNVTLSLPDDKNKSIQIYKNGMFDRNESIRPEVIALMSHKIRKFSNVTHAKDFIDSSYNLMTRLNISKNIDNSTLGKSKITINVKLPNSVSKNLTIYQIIPKPYTYDDIIFLNDGGAQRLILDKDPVIGWYFNDSSGDETIEYQLPGNTEGGSVIITQEPILFNEGNLVINYREGGCEADESLLFELDSLEDSVVYSAGSGRLYKVCIADLTYVLSNTKTNLYQHIFNFTNASNVSLNNLAGFLDEVVVSVENSTPIYWNMKIQKENPSGDYSCLGSVNDLDESLFGDCGYNLNNRIWLHLGEDRIAPTTTLSYPYMTHNLRVILEAEDNIGGSGVSFTKYCVDNDGSCVPNTLFSQDFYVTCSNDWSCRKYIRFFSEDIDGNREDIQTKVLDIIDKNSACQASCLAVPSPNRYLSECRNLNGCKYFDKGGDDGEYVAEKCDFKVEGSWVEYNSTHEVLCPMGPIRKSVYSHNMLSIYDSLCENIIKTPYPVILNGESVILNIISCINPY